jgi:hypothetical protein
MASLNHTAPAHPLVRNEPKSKSTSSVDDPFHLRSAERERRQTHASQQASTALAVAVIEGMLKTHRAFKQAHDSGERMGLLPLNPVQRIGLETAIDLLHHYVDTLSPETSG